MGECLCGVEGMGECLYDEGVLGWCCLAWIESH